MECLRVSFISFLTKDVHITYQNIMVVLHSYILSQDCISLALVPLVLGI